uniref:Uncharacterized protein n=1 Tax=Brassica oleracea var. oleracea TaxID=109376 RepID=A0A0D3BC36_BRAOL
METLSEDEKVIVVTHSLCIHDKIHMAIFITALMPSLAFNFTIISRGDVELAELLVRPQRLFSNENIDTSLVLTPERFGSVNRIFVLSDKDRTLVKEFQLWMIKNNPPNHVEHIQDSDHMVMISMPLDLGLPEPREYCPFQAVGQFFHSQCIHDKIHMAIFITALMPSLAFNFTIISQGYVELAELLVRPQRLFSNENIDTSLVLTPERFGSVNRIFVLSDKDRTLVKEFQLWMIKNNPPNHVEHIQDSDHMVMISMPLDLVQWLSFFQACKLRTSSKVVGYSLPEGPRLLLGPNNRIFAGVKPSADEDLIICLRPRPAFFTLQWTVLLSLNLLCLACQIKEWEKIFKPMPLSC